MSLRHAIRRWLIATLLLLALAVPTAAQTRATFREDAEFLYLENELARFTFSRASHGGIDGVEDCASGVDFRTDKSLPAALFNLTAVLPDGSTEDIGNLTPGRFFYQVKDLPEGVRLTLTYAGRIAEVILDI